MKRIQSVWPVLLFVAGVPLAVAAEGKDEKLETRAYDASSIVGKVRHSPLILRPRGPLIFMESRYGEPDTAEGIPLFGFEEDKAPRKRDAAQPPDPFDAFDSSLMSADNFFSHVAEQLAVLGVDINKAPPPLWWAGSVLYVRASAEIQNVIGAFVRQLGETADVLISVECLLVPLEVLDKKIPSWRADGPLLPAAVFEEALLDPRSRLLSVLARDGQRVASGSKEIQAFVVDEEVNQTGVIPVTNPVIETPFAGERLEVCPFRIPGEEAVWVDISVGRFRVTAPKMPLGIEWGELELPVTDETLISASAVAVPGKAVIVGSLEGREPELALVRARVSKPIGVAGSVAGGEGRFSRAYDVSLLLREKPSRRWPNDSSAYRFSGAEPRFADSAQLIGYLEQSIDKAEEDRFTFESGRLLFSGPRRAHLEVERIIHEEAARLSRLLAVDLEILSLGRESFAAIRGATEDGFVLKQGWEKLLAAKNDFQRRRYTFAGVPGQVHALTQAVLKTFVVNVNQVSGGTGFAIVENSDPATGTCGDGFELRIRADLLPGERARLQLEGGDARILEERLVTATFPTIPFSTGSLSSTDSPQWALIAKPPDTIKKIQLTLPRQSVQYWNAELNVPPNRDVILHADATADDGKATLLVGRVRVVR